MEPISQAEKSYLRGQLRRYVESITRPSPTGERNKYVCPFCGSGSKSRGTCGFTITDDGEHYTCFKCGEEGDIYMLMDKLGDKPANPTGDAFIDGVTRARELFGGVVSQPVQTQAAQVTAEMQARQTAIEYISRFARQLDGTDYYTQRGFTREEAEAMYFGYDAAAGRLIIPYPSGDFYISRAVSDADRSIRYRYPTGLPKPLFNAKALELGVPVFVVEGQLDAASIYCTIKDNEYTAVGLGQCSGDLLTSTLSGLKKLGAAPPLVVVMLDSDEAGDKGSSKIVKEVEALGIRAHAGRLRGAKDANELFARDRAALRLELLRILKEAEDNPFGDHIDAWREIIRRAREDGTGGLEIPTPYEELNEILDGGLTAALYILGATSSAGKTAFTLNLASELARDNDVLYFTVEMSAKTLISRCLMRLVAERSGFDAGKPTISVGQKDYIRGDRYAALNNMMRQAIDAADEELSKLKGLYIIEGDGRAGMTIEDIENRVERHVSITGRRPVVFVDYLQILAPMDPRATDKQRTDSIVLALKGISRQYDIPVFAISSFNRGSYLSPVNMAAFKESGAIEYSADVLLGLQPRGMSDKEMDNRDIIRRYKEQDIKEIELVVLKNRDGISNKSVNLRHWPWCHIVREDKGRNQQTNPYPPMPF